MSRTEAYDAYLAADNVWQAELVKVFGAKSAPNMRYVAAGKGMPGSTLRRVWEVRDAARIAFASLSS